MQEGVSENPYQGYGYLTVIKNTAELNNKYIEKVREKYNMEEDGSVYSATSLIEKYNEDFFNKNNLIIVDAESPLFISESSQIKVEQTADSKLRIVFPHSTVPQGTKTTTAHCIIEIPKTFKANEGNIVLITRTSEDASFNKLYQYVENEAFYEIRKHYTV